LSPRKPRLKRNGPSGAFRFGHRPVSFRNIQDIAMDVIELPLGQIIPYARNPRRNEKAVASVAASIAEFGWRQPIVVDEQMVVLAGHTRLEAARQLGLETAPVHVATGLTEAQARAYRLMDNRSSENAAWDEELLGLELGDLLEAAFDLEMTGFSDGELDRLLAEAVAGMDDAAGGSVPPVTIPEPPRNPASRTGDLWILGDHRLHCGDSTSHDDVRRLMNGERAILFATDPPYLVDYDGSNHPTRNKDWSQSYGTTWDDSSAGRRPLRRVHRRGRCRGDHRGCRLVLLARLPPPGNAGSLLGKGRRLRPSADHLGEGPGRPDPLALPLEARALLHGLAPSEPSAEGRRADAALDLGDAVLRQG
jgi:ParB-like chromosome segregation protein Spo0J